ncbi:cytochrome P450 3A11 [Nephila pilipes]|uniref:Cytochrome P450 3A11 n=1 Tax=Nephila pilipes TaxID=299642 RepID=A0A8X6MXY0_NEPPI|nr:cytochrome P450 3A11 [Nephila pilipes]
MLSYEFPLNLWVTPLLILLCIVLLYRFTTRNLDYWEKRNIPYVKPFPIVGSVTEYIREPLFQIEQRRHKKFGRIYGYFEGNRPLLAISDPELLRQILVKDFYVFPERRVSKNRKKLSEMFYYGN